MESPTTLLELTLSDPERSNSKSHLSCFISRKGAVLEHALLNTNRESYMASPTARLEMLDMSLRDVER